MYTVYIFSNESKLYKTFKITNMGKSIKLNGILAFNEDHYIQTSNLLIFKNRVSFFGIICIRPPVIFSANLSIGFGSILERVKSLSISTLQVGIYPSSKDNFKYENALKEYFLENPNNPIYLYLHIPYCAKLCYYCSCRLHISNNRETINDFVKILIKECNMLEDFFRTNNIKPNIKEIHLGGGTPSHLTVDELTQIINNLKKFIKV